MQRHGHWGGDRYSIENISEIRLPIYQHSTPPADEDISHYTDVVSLSWRFNSPADWLFTQQLPQVNNVENIEAHHCRHLSKWIVRWQVNALQRANIPQVFPCDDIILCQWNCLIVHHVFSFEIAMMQLYNVILYPIMELTLREFKQILMGKI